MIFSACPFVFGYAMHASWNASDRLWAGVALGVAGLEFAGWCFLLCAEPGFLIIVGGTAAVFFVMKQFLDYV